MIETYRSRDTSIINDTWSCSIRGWKQSRVRTNTVHLEVQRRIAFLLYSWFAYEYPKLHWDRSYFNKMMKNLCYEDDVVKRSVFEPPHFPLEMLDIAPPKREKRPFSIWR